MQWRLGFSWRDVLNVLFFISKVFSSKIWFLIDDIYKNYFKLKIMFPEKCKMLIYVCVIFLITPFGQNMEHQMFYDQSKVEEGKFQLLVMERHSELPKYGECWKVALRDLRQGCRALNEIAQAHLALNFTNCFLTMNNMATYPCHSNQEIGACLNNINDKAYNSYSNFFTHTQSMCFFLQSQVWHEETEDTIHRLEHQSTLVSKRLENASSLQELMLLGQKESLSIQTQMLQNSSILSNSLDQSMQIVKALASNIQEVQETNTNQKMLILEVFDRLESMQELFLGEMSWLYTLGFYISSLIVSYLGTATDRTKGARLGLFILLTFSAMTERFLFQYTVYQEALLPGLASNTQKILHSRFWMCRQSFMLLGCIYFIWCSLKYQDLSKMNNQLLREIHHQNKMLAGYVQQGIQSAPPVYTPFPVPISSDMTVDLSTNMPIGFNDDSSSSTESDHTFYPDSCSDSEFETPDGSVMNIPITTPIRRYNLRTRPSPSPNVTKELKESPRTFAKTVKNMAVISKQNSFLLRQFPGHSPRVPLKSQLSSDDETLY